MLKFRFWRKLRNSEFQIEKIWTKLKLLPKKMNETEFVKLTFLFSVKLMGDLKEISVNSNFIVF